MAISLRFTLWCLGFNLFAIWHQARWTFSGNILSTIVFTYVSAWARVLQCWGSLRILVISSEGGQIFGGWSRPSWNRTNIDCIVNWNWGEIEFEIEKVSRIWSCTAFAAAAAALHQNHKKVISGPPTKALIETIGKLVLKIKIKNPGGQCKILKSTIRLRTLGNIIFDILEPTAV